MRVLIVGYYGYGNAGDEAMLQIVIKEIKKRFPDANITIWSANPEKTKNETGCKAYFHPFAGGKKWWKQVYEADVLIFGGGTFLQDYGKGSIYPWQNLTWYLKVVGLARIIGKKVLMLGIGVGPLQTLCGKIIALFTVGLANWVGLRDEESLRYLKWASYFNKNIHLTEDLVFLLGKNKKKRSNTQPTIIRIGINLRELKVKSDCLVLGGEMLSSLAEFIQDFSKVKPCVIHLIPFQEGELGDSNILKQFATLYCLNENIVIHDKVKDFESLYSLIQDMDIVIAMRLHAIIFSVLAEKPVIALSYHQKVSSFAERWMIPCYDISSLHRGANIDIIKKILELLDQEFHYPISKGIEKAKENFHGLDILSKNFGGFDA